MHAQVLTEKKHELFKIHDDALFQRCSFKQIIKREKGFCEER